jgi:ubiquinone/menaquinone biosynthesis C-methylase UbiE
MTNFKDLFSTQSFDYSKFRPLYPKDLFEWLAKQTSSHHTAWDCGTGNGQAATVLADFYSKVYATDPSEKQLKAATPKANVIYSVGSAESSGLPNSSVDLITVAQAYHWFQHEKFFAEVRRVAKPAAVVAVWSYGLAVITPGVDAAVMRLYEELLGPYWEKERRHVENQYRDLPFPFTRIEAPPFHMSAQWSFEHLIGYLGTWSALQTYLKKEGHDPREAIFEDLKNAWGSVGELEVRWELTLLAGRV